MSKQRKLIYVLTAMVLFIVVVSHFFLFFHTEQEFHYDFASKSENSNKEMILLSFHSKGKYIRNHNFFCDCVRMNALMNISLNYIGYDDEKYDKYGNNNIEKFYKTHKYLHILSQKYSLHQQQNSIIILFVDAFDVFFQQSSIQILNRFLEIRNSNLSFYKNKVIFGTQYKCLWPEGACKYYSEREDLIPNHLNKTEIDSKWLNSGTYIAYLYDILRLFDDILQFEIVSNQEMSFDENGKEIVRWRSDQEIIVWHYLHNQTPNWITLDFSANIFVSKAYNRHLRLESLNNAPLYYNENMKNYPCILHFNGGAKPAIPQLIRPLIQSMFGDANTKISGNTSIKFTTNYTVSHDIKYSVLCLDHKAWFY